MFAQQDDFLLRQVRNFAAALLAAWSGSQLTPPELEEFAKSAGLDLGMAARLTPEAVRGLLTMTDGIDVTRALPLALALAARGHQRHAQVLIEAALARRPEIDSPELRGVLAGRK